jgi:hypothetical protein
MGCGCSKKSDSDNKKSKGTGKNKQENQDVLIWPFELILYRQKIIMEKTQLLMSKERTKTESKMLILTIQTWYDVLVMSDIQGNKAGKSETVIDKWDSNDPSIIN